ncbi:MAG: S46 family peptidase [Bacteroidia bacterium]|nr:S46 family peptidase [Bacteroidia bacterium]
MKKLVFLFVAITQLFSASADEGMWILSLLNKQEAAMKAKGLKLSAEDIYNVNKSSVKDAIVWFNGGCSGEIVSNEGLLLTNHHCGYDVIAGLSTPEDNILDNGFYAQTKAEEKRPNSALSVSILQKIEDVTQAVLAELQNLKDESERAAKIKELTNKYKKEYGNNDPFIDVRLYEMFKGNQYFVFVYEKFTDVRFVGTPPQNVGKYGGDSDNWMWPRHTGDFSIFRIYANKDNKPANYSADNVPYKPKHYLPVSLKGVSEGDFAMIIGFPGRTNRYEFAEAVKLSLDESNMSIVDMRNIRLTEWRKIMDKDVATRLKLSSQYARVANYWKYFIGQTEQLKRLHVYDDKKSDEKVFQQWANNKSEYKDILTHVSTAVDAYRPYAKHLYYIAEGVWTPEIMTLARYTYAISSSYDQNDEAAITKNINAFKTAIQEKDWNPLLWEADQKIFARIVYKYYTDIPKDQQPELIAKIAQKYKFDKAGIEGAYKFAADFYKKSNLSSKAKAEKFASKLSKKNIAKDNSSEFFATFATLFNNQILPKYRTYLSQINEYGRTYIKGIMEMQNTPPVATTDKDGKATLISDEAYEAMKAAEKYAKKELYPDANSSIRLSYGTVKSYEPRDGVHYDYVTNMKGVLDKYVPGDIEFDLSPKFYKLAKDRNYGQYADKDGRLKINFLTDNDITGGNSGSPVMNGNGELIGIAFDGNWEAMSGDIYFDPTYKRTISVDIRYVLWCIDILGGAPHIVAEMTLVK